MNAFIDAAMSIPIWVWCALIVLWTVFGFAVLVLVRTFQNDMRSGAKPYPGSSPGHSLRGGSSTGRAPGAATSPPKSKRDARTPVASRSRDLHPARGSRQNVGRSHPLCSERPRRGDPAPGQNPTHTSGAGLPHRSPLHRYHSRLRWQHRLERLAKWLLGHGTARLK